MKNTAVLTFLLIIMSCSASAQERKDTIVSKWKTKLQAGFNINQASFSDNWKGGGTNSVAWNALLNYNANYNTEFFEWTNDLQTTYGNLKNKGQGMRKNADRIFFESKLSYKISKSWRVFGSATFMSQFDAGFDYSNKSADGSDSSIRISGFFAPAYLTEAVGMEYKPVEWFSAQFGVGALRQTFVLDETLYSRTGKTTLYGVDRGQNMRNQIVFQLVAEVNKEIMKNVTLKARYQGIADYQKLNGQGFVHRLDVNILAKVNRFVTTSIGSVLLYDYDQDKDVQYSQLLNIGILYTLQNYVEKK